MKQRKIMVKFFSEKELKRFSEKIMIDTNYELTKNVSELKITDYNNKLSYKLTFKKVLGSYNKQIKEWQKHWVDLTDFEITDKSAIATIEIYFPELFTNSKLTELFEQTITDKTKSLIFPKKESSNVNCKRYLGQRGNPMYPIYIISKGRSKTCVTADHLLKMEVPFKIVIEKQEWNDYAEVYGEDCLLELDLSFRAEYDTYIENFDSNKSKGSGPARNFVWNHAKESGAKFHWIMDDNIFGFNYFYDDQRIKAVDGSIFASAEDFVNRYENIAIAGLNYYMFAVPGSKDKPYVANTKIYSCLLINNHVPIRWAGRYNEDVDICIRALKEGYSTIQFDAFLAKKGATQTMGGGNTDAFYAEEGTLPKSNMLMYNHPDITEVTWRFQRWHHITNYDIFDFYKDRNLKETIMHMLEPQILDSNEDAKIIQDIKSIDFSKIKKWNILEYVPRTKREKILKVLKFYRYKKDTDFIINKLTEPKLLNSDLNSYLLDTDLEDTLDNKIMLDIFSLGDTGNSDGTLVRYIDFNSYFSYIPENRRNRIIAELMRNKYLLTDYEKNNYILTEVILSEEDHLIHRDSKAHIENILNGTNKEEIVTLFDKKMRKETDKIVKPKIQSKLTSRSTKIEKTIGAKTLMITGDEAFNNSDLFEKECKNSIQEHSIDELINSVFYKVDLMSANYALDNKMMNKEFVPDILLHTNAAYNEMYKNMIECADYILIFVDSKLTKDLEFLVNLCNENNKEYKIIEDKIIAEDW